MKFYAYIPSPVETGNHFPDEPFGTFDKTLFELKTVRGAHRRASKVLGNDYKLYSYSNFYKQDTFKEHKYMF